VAPKSVTISFYGPTGLEQGGANGNGPRAGVNVIQGLNRLQPWLSQLWKRYPVSSYVLVTAALMFGLYAALYQPYSADSAPGRVLHWYLTKLASLSSVCLNLGGEDTQAEGNTVFGRFPFSVVLDCAALDAQALFTAAVVAFPAPIWKRAVGLGLGLIGVFLLNLARLVALYFAGASSLDLFHWLHEEVFVLVIIALVCGMFAVWARWSRPSPERPRQLETESHAT
jgi:exosortase/archaeosortase family protein